jgi:hypothetical protein
MTNLPGTALKAAPKFDPETIFGDKTVKRIRVRRALRKFIKKEVARRVENNLSEREPPSVELTSEFNIQMLYGALDTDYDLESKDVPLYHLLEDAFIANMPPTEKATDDDEYTVEWRQRAADFRHNLNLYIDKLRAIAIQFDTMLDRQKG